MKKIFSFCGMLLFLSNPAYAAFPDVAENHEYKNAILWLQQEGYVKGFSDGTYRPTQKITRAEFTKILLLAKFSQSEIDACDDFAFDDSEVGAWYLPFLCFAREEGIVNGYPDNTFKPHRNINYAEASKIIVNTLVGVQTEGNGEDWWKPFAEVLEDKDAVPAAVKGGEHAITRGEMASIIYELSGSPELDDAPTSSLSPTPSATPDANATQTEFLSEQNAIRFTYEKGFAADAATYPTQVIEKGAQMIIAAETPQTDFAKCVDAGLCEERDGKKLAYLDAIFVLSKGKDDTDLEAAIISKVEQSGKNFAACRLIDIDEAPEGWTKVRVEPIEYESFMTDGNGGYSDAQGNKITLFEMSRLKDKEASEKCGTYASGFGKSFFLYNPGLSENRFLFVPAYGETYLIDHASVRFE